MEIVIIVLLLASLFGVWLLSVRRKLETQEDNIRNAMYRLWYSSPQSGRHWKDWRSFSDRPWMRRLSGE